MDAIIQQVIEAFVSAGPIGIAILAIMAIVYYAHNQIMENNRQHSKTTLEESKKTTEAHKASEEKLMSMIEKNTEALTKNAASQENCTSAIKDMSVTLNSAINLLHQMSTMFKEK